MRERAAPAEHPRCGEREGAAGAGAGSVQSRWKRSMTGRSELRSRGFSRPEAPGPGPYSPGVEARVFVNETGRGHSSVDLGGAEVGVTEHFLD